MKTFLCTLFLLTIIVGCAPNEDTDENDSITTGIAQDEDSIKETAFNWDDDSSRILISQDNGNVPPGENRYIKYDYFFADLSSESADLISNIEITNESLFCSNDGVTYEMKISDGTGITLIYVSNNRDCGRENETSFVSINYIQAIIDSL